MTRQNEVDNYLSTRYKDYRIVEVTQTYFGDVIDWLDPATVPGSQIEQPPKPIERALPPGVESSHTELDMHPELRGPAGTIPVVRPRFAAYVRGESTAGSLEEFIKMQQRPGQPAGQYRLYAGYYKTALNIEVKGWANDFQGTNDSGTFSVTEMLTLCNGSNAPTTGELVGVAAARGPANFGDSVLRLQVEFYTAGFNNVGNYIGGWDGLVLGFVPAAGRPYGPGVTLAASTINGTQYEQPFDILLFNGNWWIAHNGNWLGYYEGWRFDLMPSRGCEAHWYGEVFDPTPTSWTNTNMGSGLYASQGFGKAAYFRDPHYVDTGNVARWPDSPFASFPYVSACYSRSAYSSGSSPWDRFFYLGGPGGEAVGCD